MRRPRGRDELEAEPHEGVRNRDDRLFVGVADGDERRPAARQGPACRALCLREGGREVGGRRHHLARRPHLGPEHRIGAGKSREREHSGFDADLRGRRVGRQVEVGEVRARREPTRSSDEVDPARLAREWHGSRGARVDLEHVKVALRDRKLDVEEADNAERGAQLPDNLFHVRVLERAQRRRRQHAG